MFNKIKKYCLGKSKLSVIQEKQFLENASLQEFTGVNLSKNSGKISEWYVAQLLTDKCVEFITQPIIKYGPIVNKKQRYLQPDFYIPDKNMFIEVKSRTYNCGGTASEKVDHAARKYSTKLALTENYKEAKVLIVFCAGELFEETTLQLINYKDNNTSDYVKSFIEFTKQHAVLDWININDIEKYL
jgi:hypothetical protein